MNEIVWPTIDSKHLIVDSKQMLILEKEMFSDGMPQEALMEKAGIQISRWLLKRKPLLKHGITVLIGPGHNGGDGAVVARELFLKGFLGYNSNPNHTDVDSEFEGNEDANTAVPKSLELLRNSFYYNLT